MARACTLTAEEMRVAALAGAERRIRSFNRPDNHGFDGRDGWTIDIEGAAGEMAFAKILNRYWGCDCDTFKKPDVSGAQVRTVKEDGLCLIVRDEDPDDQYYVLIVGEAPSFRLAGWIKGSDAKHERFKRAPNGRPPAYFVPESELAA